MLRWIFALFAGIGAVPASTQNMKGITLDTAVALPPRALALRVLGATGVDFEEAVPYWISDVSARNVRLYAVEFATRPRATKYPGLCVTDVYSVAFATDQPQSPISASPSRLFTPDRMEVSARYHVLSSGASLVGSTRPSWKKLNRLCAAAAPALRRPGGPKTDYFTAYMHPHRNPEFSAAHAYFAVSALAAAQAPNMSVDCRDQAPDPRYQLCREPKAIIGALKLSAIDIIRIEKCHDWPAQFCLTFPALDDPLHAHATSVTIVTDAKQIDDFERPPIVQSVLIEGLPLVF